MFLIEPPPSQGDLHFRLFGVPVRVSPFFWVTTVIMGLGTRAEGTPPAQLLIWVGVVLVSILVHELGHAFLQRRFGGRPWIVLHGIGGLAICDDCDRGPRSQILISLAGPAAGFLLAAAVIALVRLSGHVIGASWSGAIPWEQAGIASARGVTIVRAIIYWEPFASNAANTLLHNMLFVNIVWGLVNLLPVYPLDGGRVARELCTLRNPRRGIVLSLQISIVAAGAMAVVGVLAWQSLYTALMFGYLAFTNYQALQAYQRNYW
jgi:stage IV sporulation protein FB